MGVVFSIYNYFMGSGEHKVVMVGLDNAGKSTILYRLCAADSPAHLRPPGFAAPPHRALCVPGRHLGDVIQTQPTVGSNVEEVVHRNVRFQVWDLGGQETLRKVWSTYFVGAHAVVLVVDSMDRERIGLVREELAAITAHEELRKACLLVLANKQDLPSAMDPVEITQSLKLHLNKEHAWHIQPCSAVTGAGLMEGMDWVAHTLRNSNR